MARFIAMGYTAEELRILNHVQKHQQVLFISDILGAGGGSVDKWYLTKHLPGEWWSSMKFPWKVVNELEMGLWYCAIMQVVTHGPAQASPGAFKVDGHIFWECKTGTKLKCMHTSEGADISTFVPVVQVGCEVRWLPWRRARRVRCKSAQSHLLLSA